MTNGVITLIDRVSVRVLGDPREGRRFVKFAIVGGIGAIVDFSILNLLILVPGWEKFINIDAFYSWVPDYDWRKFFANIVSVTCAIISNFWWNRRWTFPESREHDLHVSFGKFAAVNLVGLVINQTVFVLTDQYIFGRLFDHPFDYNLAKATAIGIVLFWNFFVNRRWTYRGI